jgi:hypothetical protein
VHCSPRFNFRKSRTEIEVRRGLKATRGERGENHRSKKIFLGKFFKAPSSGLQAALKPKASKTSFRIDDLSTGLASPL